MVHIGECNDGMMATIHQALLLSPAQAGNALFSRLRSLTKAGAGA